MSREGEGALERGGREGSQEEAILLMSFEPNSWRKDWKLSGKTCRAKEGNSPEGALRSSLKRRGS